MYFWESPPQGLAEREDNKKNSVFSEGTCVRTYVCNPSGFLDL